MSKPNAKASLSHIRQITRQENVTLTDVVFLYVKFVLVPWVKPPSTGKFKETQRGGGRGVPLKSVLDKTSANSQAMPDSPDSHHLKVSKWFSNFHFRDLLWKSNSLHGALLGLVPLTTTTNQSQFSVFPLPSFLFAFLFFWTSIYISDRK